MFILHFRLFILLGFLFLSNSSFGQAQDNKVLYPTGLGKFKIGITTIQSLPKLDSMYLSFNLIKNVIDSVNNNGLKSIDFGEEFRYALDDSDFYYGKDVKMGVVKKYNITGVELNLVLVFYKDTLFKITTFDFRRLENKWILKYGKGIQSYGEYPKICFVNGVEFEKKRKHFTTFWENESLGIKGSHYLLVFITDNCEEKVYSDFVIENIRKMEFVKEFSENYKLDVYRETAKKRKKQAIDSEL
jgi:hypothetical protein